MGYDFSGWATRNNIQCSDGRIIRQNAFIGNDKATVPICWNHQHDDPLSVLGHGVLENRSEGVYMYGSFNDTESGRAAKNLVEHGDIVGLSIYANQLKQNGSDVIHGNIREVSLVLAGANPGAYIDSIIKHSDSGEEEAYITLVFDDVIEHGFLSSKKNTKKQNDKPWVSSIAKRMGKTDEELLIELEHLTDKHIKGEPYEFPSYMQAWADEVEANIDKTSAQFRRMIEVYGISSSIKNTIAYYANENKVVHAEEVPVGPVGDIGDPGPDTSITHAEDPEKESEDKTVGEILDTMTEDQKNLMYLMIMEALDNKDDNNKEETNMKHNAFDSAEVNTQVEDTLSHSEVEAIFADATRSGSLKYAVLQHGIDNMEYLYPEDHNLNPTPEFIKRDTGWVSTVMNSVYHVPFSKIKSQFANITGDEARAKGYVKGNYKTEEVIALLRRSTSPTTIYKKQAMDRDDIIDITDFNVVAWLKSEMRLMLDEEIARAILVGDGRSAASEDKIDPTHIRPVWTDDDLYTIKKSFTPANNASDDDKAKLFIRAAVKARKDYKGSGNPVLFTTEDILTDCLLIEDTIGHRLYKDEKELAMAMRVSAIITVPVMENLTRSVTVSGSAYTNTLWGIIVNLTDYCVGADKGGSISMFEDFDIDYNKEKYLIETRCSGALRKPYSAIALEMSVAQA